MNPPTPSETRNLTPDVSQQLPGNAANLQLTLQLAQLLSQNNPISQAAPQLMLPQAASLQSLLPLLGLQVNGNANLGASSSMPQERPVGTYPSDEEIMVHALKEAEGKGLSYKQALEGLHGINGHLAHQWKDYYLEHARRINLSLAEKPQVWAKKPSLDKMSSHQHDRRVSFSQQDSSKADYSSARRDSSSSKHRLDDDLDRGSNGVAKRSKRDSPHYNGKGKRTLHDIPSREPTPPQHTVSHLSRERYVRYTDDDREYLIKYANYRLAEDPNLKKTDISHELARKAPHHSRMSWQSHWSANRQELDRYIIYYKDLLDPNAPSGDEDLGSDSDGNSQEEDDYQSDEESDAEEDLQNMSRAGESINDADRRVISRYIASIGSEWDMLSSRDKWKPFEVQYPQRTYKAWTEVYRNHAKTIDPIVRRYRKQARARIQSQKATPAWARKKTE